MINQENIKLFVASHYTETPFERTLYMKLEKCTMTMHYTYCSVGEVGSPINHLGSGQRRDTDQGPFSSARSTHVLTPPELGALWGWHATIYISNIK